MVEGMTVVEDDDGNVSVDYEFWRCQDDEGNNTCTPVECTKCQRGAFESFWSGESDVVGFRGGFRAGKSVLGVRAIILGALAFAGTDWLVLAKDRAKGKITTFPVFCENLPGENTGLKNDGLNTPENSPIVQNFDRTELRVDFINGSSVYLGGADTVDRYDGAEFSGVHMDEAAHYKVDLHDLILSNLLSRFSADTGIFTVLCTTTPNGFNQYYDIIERRVDKEGNPLDTDIEDIVASSQDNPFIDERTKNQQLKNLDVDSEVAGGWGSADGLVYDRFSRVDNVVELDDVAERLIPGWRVYGYDAGVRDKRVVLEVGKTRSGQLVVLDEFYKSDTLVDDAIDWLDEKPDGIIYSEHQPEHLMRFRRAGWSAVNANKSIDYGIDEVRDRLRVDDEFGPGLLVVESCSNTIDEFTTYKQEDIGGSNVDDHAMDTLRYIIASDYQAVGNWGGDVMDESLKVRLQSGGVDVTPQEDEDNETVERDDGVPSLGEVARQKQRNRF